VLFENKLQDPEKAPNLKIQDPEKTPNLKNQDPNKHQAKNKKSKHHFGERPLIFDLRFFIYLELGSWFLGFFTPESKKRNGCLLSSRCECSRFRFIRKT
jgi:hypothetical protein